jgi:hypothetical protein
MIGVVAAVIAAAAVLSFSRRLVKVAIKALRQVCFMTDKPRISPDPESGQAF